ncbi:type IV pilus modification protein PilV [Marinobacter sp. M216]|uniref:Type IV pilus modification protein PilV n=1 Tax=Marinobacter albus TaxID=3030833 RepID=A0ABT7HJ11_9GAMM|nr:MULTISPECIES: type IV pilus modification protein PilV [unclassified Marinobacter]MBW7473097.1 type IV pilus modification protein PilV [Marinobacter sp. F4218]MDK9559510.1 type IV pilus modification protein PilV [Marinobacter sp. M216]
MSKDRSHKHPVFHVGPAARCQSGFTLIEILITVFILAIGLLGLAGLILEGMRNNQGAYLRTQASILAYDMADRMRANKPRAADYAGFTTDGASTALPACASDAGGCTPAGQAQLDLVEWTRQIEGVGSDMALLPGGVGTIQHDAATSRYTITVTWDEVARQGDAGETIAGDSSYSVRFSL